MGTVDVLIRLCRAIKKTEHFEYRNSQHHLLRLEPELAFGNPATITQPTIQQLSTTGFQDQL